MTLASVPRYLQLFHFIYLSGINIGDSEVLRNRRTFCSFSYKSFLLSIPAQSRDCSVKVDIVAEHSARVGGFRCMRLLDSIVGFFMSLSSSEIGREVYRSEGIRAMVLSFGSLEI